MDSGRRVLCCVIGLVMVAAPAGGQSLLERTPNVTGGWIGERGTVHFNFLHRFTKSGPPDNQISNNPTFLLGTGVVKGGFVGFNYATRSNLVARYPNEWEFFGRYAPLRTSGGAPLDLGVQAAYNIAANSVDGELSLGRTVGPVRVLGTARLLLHGYDSGETRYAIGGGAVFRVNRWIALAGDAVTLLDRADGEEVAWGAGLQLGIPLTPHTLSLQVTNTNAASIQGSSRGDDIMRYGFEFTVPVTLSRIFGRRPANEPVTLASDAKAAQNTVRMQRIAFDPKRIEVAQGSTVAWRNDDQVVHTVRASNGSWESPQIPPGGTYTHVFAQPGRYEITCGPHPFMTMIVEVR